MSVSSLEPIRVVGGGSGGGGGAVEWPLQHMGDDAQVMLLGGDVLGSEPLAPFTMLAPGGMNVGNNGTTIWINNGGDGTLNVMGQLAAGFWDQEARWLGGTTGTPTFDPGPTGFKAGDWAVDYGGSIWINTADGETPDWTEIAPGGGGGGGGAVDSVDGRTGVVTLGDKYVDVSGDVITGDLTINGGLALGSDPDPGAALKINRSIVGGYPKGISVSPTLAPDNGNSAHVAVIHATIDTRTGYVVQDAYGLMVSSLDKAGSGTINRTYGAFIFPSNVGVQGFGLAIDYAKTCTLHVCAGQDSAQPNAGIAFGMSRDTSLFRGGANQLRTMSTFVADGWVQSDVGFRVNVAGLPQWRGGPGSPEGAVTASIGSIWSRTDGGTGTALYRKEANGAGNTGWVAVTTGGGGGAAQTGWSVTPGHTADKALDPQNTTVNELANVVGSLITSLIAYGALAP